MPVEDLVDPLQIAYFVADVGMSDIEGLFESGRTAEEHPIADACLLVRNRNP